LRVLSDWYYCRLCNRRLRSYFCWIVNAISWYYESPKWIVTKCYQFTGVFNLFFLPIHKNNIW
jgi:hypothetical protein